MDQEKVLNIARDYAASVRKVIDAADVFLYYVHSSMEYKRKAVEGIGFLNEIT